MCPELGGGLAVEELQGPVGLCLVEGLSQQGPFMDPHHSGLPGICDIFYLVAAPMRFWSVCLSSVLMDDALLGGKAIPWMTSL